MVKYEYDAWGNHSVSGSNTDLGKLNPFRYRSYFYDTETGLYFLKSRYYDPYIGRFLNMDSVDYAEPETINGLNLYAYCGNNPVMNVDPDGHAFITTLIVCMVVGAIVSGTINASIAAANGESAKSIFGAFVGGAIVGAVLGGAAALGGGLAVGAYTASAFSIAGTAAYLTVGTFAGGMVSYGLENYIKGNDMTWGEAFSFGALTFTQGLFSFITGYGLGGAGLWNSLKPGNGLFSIISKNGVANGVKAYLSANAYPIAMRAFIKSIFTTPWNLIKP